MTQRTIVWILRVITILIQDFNFILNILIFFFFYILILFFNIISFFILRYLSALD